MRFSLSHVTKVLTAQGMGLFLILLVTSAAFAQNTPSKLQPLKDRADNLLWNFQVEPALELYEEIIASEPNFANAHYNMAICYKELKQFDKAYCALEKFVNLKPKDSEAYFNMGIMQVYLGNDDKARTLLKKARALNPSRDVKKRIKDALDHLQQSMFPQESLAAIQALYANQQS